MSGSVPPGMGLGHDCSLAGRPSQIGAFASQLSFSVSGHPGSAGVNVQMVVGGPVLQPTGTLPHNSLLLLSPLAPSDVPGMFAQSQYTLLAGDAIPYAIVSGSLPTGLTLDPASGKVEGAPLALGSFEVTLGATLHRNGKDCALNSVPVCTYLPGEVCGGLSGDRFAYERIPSIATGAVPPPWASVDPVTGVISVSAPETSTAGSQVGFGPQVTTRRGSDTIVSKQS